MKCSRSSTPDWHIGQSGAEGCLYLQVARTFMSTRSLIKILRTSWFFIADRYVLRSYSFLHWFRYINLLDARILLSHACCNWSFNLWTNVFPKFGVTGAGSKNTSPNPFCFNKYLMLCNHGSSFSHAILKAAFNNTLLVPWQRRNQYFTASLHALCSNGNLTSSPCTVVLLCYWHINWDLVYAWHSSYVISLGHWYIFPWSPEYH